MTATTEQQNRLLASIELLVQRIEAEGGLSDELILLLIAHLISVEMQIGPCPAVHTLVARLQAVLNAPAPVMTAARIAAFRRGRGKK